MPARGFEVVLTGDEGLVSHYFGTYLGFMSALPMDVFPRWLGELVFPTKSDKSGRMKTSQLGLCRIEASLLRAGFPREKVAIVDPRKLEDAVGPETKVVGVGVLDPLGVNYGTALLRLLLRIMGFEAKLQSYMSWATMKILESPALRRGRRPRVIVGGQGAWEIVDSGLQDRLGIDVVVEGEGELVAPELFARAVRGDPLPKHVRGRVVPPEQIPPIVTPSRGVVEITRGCGRGCRFCNPTLLAFRSLPKETILRDVATNLEGGERHITLHSEDFLRYGGRGLEPDREKLLGLLASVRRLAEGCARVGVDFVTPSTAVANKRLLMESAELLGVGEGFSIIEIGIETASPRLLRIVAPGKPLPFKHEDWAEVVEESVLLLNDAGWWVCATTIIGLPQETEEDVEKNIELFERLRPHRVFVFPLPFIPSGGLRRAKGLSSEELLRVSPRSLELAAAALADAVEKIGGLAGELTRHAPPGVRGLLALLLKAGAFLGLRRLRRLSPEPRAARKIAAAAPAAG